MHTARFRKILRQIFKPQGEETRWRSSDSCALLLSGSGWKGRQPLRLRVEVTVPASHGGISTGSVTVLPGFSKSSAECGLLKKRHRLAPSRPAACKRNLDR